eukprot:m.29810 g.29810  ORF g.29810 m.29810 type:complete len:384 (-) comp11978_c0_seq2:531-1682(-)
MSRTPSDSSNGEDLQLPASTWDPALMHQHVAVPSSQPLVGYSAPTSATGYTPSPNSRMTQQVAYHAYTSSVPAISSPLSKGHGVSMVQAPLPSQPYPSSALASYTMPSMSASYTLPAMARTHISTAHYQAYESPPSVRGSPYKPRQSQSTNSRASRGSSKTPTKSCNCKNSKCLKLYCECFSNGEYCGPSCNCLNCSNTVKMESARRAAIETTLARNPNAFRPKIGSAKNKRHAASGRHLRGCRCSKSKCLKRYCECFQAGIHCTEACQCTNCCNGPDSEVLRNIRTANPREPTKGKSKTMLPAVSNMVDALTRDKITRFARSALEVSSNQMVPAEARREHVVSLFSSVLHSVVEAGMGAKINVGHVLSSSEPPAAKRSHLQQ